MKIWRGLILFLFFPFLRGLASAAPASSIRIQDVSTDLARYAPGEPVSIHIAINPGGESIPQTGLLRVSFFHVGEPVGSPISEPVHLSGSATRTVNIRWQPPHRDFTGYFVDVQFLDGTGRELARSETAVDVSSEWNRFPRYGYLAHYSRAEGADPKAWISELNEFHIDGLQFYDFQDRHEQPLAGTVAHPDSHWLDIAGREIDRSVLDGYLAAAHQHHMMAMAYDSAYSAYSSAFADGSGVRLQWATWNTGSGPRTLKTANSLNLPTNGSWQTHRLIIMNLDCMAWQNYLFGRMAQLFQVYPFDGWHIDTYGGHGAYAYDGSYLDFISGFRSFVNRASETLHKRVLLNTVSTLGQEQIARSNADFVYSELWDQNETYDSILTAADQVHQANPNAGLIFAAYLHRRDGKSAAAPAATEFNMPSVLLADATIFAAGAGHIELGDGTRMLSSDYFPNDAKLQVSPALHVALRHYYDFLTAYENILRDNLHPLPLSVELPGHASSSNGTPNTVWTISRRKNDRIMVHLINLLGSNSDHWRDVNVDRPDAPLLHQVRVRIDWPQKILSAGWASPDVDGGRFHALAYTYGCTAGKRYIEVNLASLKYWDLVVLNVAKESNAVHDRAKESTSDGLTERSCTH